MECTKVTDLCFLITTESLSTLLGERDEPSGEHRLKEHPVYGGDQCLHERHSMPLGDFALVPLPVHIDAEA
jgi:hypothetical protein